MSLPVFDRSVLEGVNPRGRVDVLASQLLRKVAERRGLSGQLEAVRPAVDLALLYFLGPQKEFVRAIRSLESPKRTKRPRWIAGGPVERSSRSRRVKTKVIDAEVVSL